jgi:cytidylate kinase
MSVITISREIGSEGEYIARKVASGLGYHFADKVTIEAILAQYGMIEFDRVYNTTPGFWERADATREAAIRFLNTTVTALARHGNIVILGRGSYALLQGYVDVLNVRLQAPSDVRVRRILTEKGFADFEEASAFVKREDKARMSFVASTYGVRWDDAGAFDLVIDTGKVDPDRAAAWLVEAAGALPASAGEHGPATRTIEADEVLVATIGDVLACHAEHEAPLHAVAS